MLEIRKKCFLAFFVFLPASNVLGNSLLNVQAYQTACGIPLGVKLPANPGTMLANAEDNGWRLVEHFEGTEVFINPGKSANLWNWSNDATNCYYLYRFNDLSGILCYQSTGEICAFDSESTKVPGNWTDFILPNNPTIDKCYDCHIHGYNAPLPKIKGVADGQEWLTDPSKWKKYAKEGGPIWKPGPGQDSFGKSGQGVCSLPNFSSCVSCHGNSWVKPLNPSRYFPNVFDPAFKTNGSMYAIGPNGSKKWEKIPIPECSTFLKCIGCTDLNTVDAICETGFNLTTQIAPPGAQIVLAGSGVITSDDNRIDCGALCWERYANNTPVTLTATPDANSVFGGWSQDCQGNSRICKLTMDQNKRVTATFCSNKCKIATNGTCSECGEVPLKLKKTGSLALVGSTEDITSHQPPLTIRASCSPGTMTCTDGRYFFPTERGFQLGVSRSKDPSTGWWLISSPADVHSVAKWVNGCTSVTSDNICWVTVAENSQPALTCDFSCENGYQACTPTGGIVGCYKSCAKQANFNSKTCRCCEYEGMIETQLKYRCCMGTAPRSACQ